MNRPARTCGKTGPAYRRMDDQVLLTFHRRTVKVALLLRLRRSANRRGSLPPSLFAQLVVGFPNPSGEATSPLRNLYAHGAVHLLLFHIPQPVNWDE